MTHCSALSVVHDHEIIDILRVFLNLSCASLLSVFCALVLHITKRIICAVNNCISRPMFKQIEVYCKNTQPYYTTFRWIASVLFFLKTVFTVARARWRRAWISYLHLFWCVFAPAKMLCRIIKLVIASLGDEPITNSTLKILTQLKANSQLKAK